MAHSRQKKTKLLFITEATATGAPLLLLDVLRILKKSPEYDIKILVKRHGELVNEFRKISKTYVVKGKLYRIKNAGFFLKAFRLAVSVVQRAIIYPGFLKTNVIISNAVVNGRLIRELRFLKARVICYVHELRYVMDNWTPQADIQNSLKYSDLFIVPSKVIQQNLIVFGVPSGKIRLFRTYIPAIELNDLNSEKKNAKDKFCDKFDLPRDSFLVAGMGTADKRKGIDLFVETACIVSARTKNIRFTWIGGFADDSIKQEVLSMIESYGLGNTIVFTGALPRSAANLLPFDLFFLSSREDPYPLVVLEAAALQIPSVCFKDSGGIVDFVSDYCGWAVDQNLEEVADLIINLSKEPEQLRFTGTNAEKKFIQQHTDKEKVKEEFSHFIKSV